MPDDKEFLKEFESWQQAAAEDMLKHIPPLTEEEYNYYMSLPDKK